MFGIKLGSQFLDIYPNTVFSCELNSPLYLGDDVDVIQGSLVFTVAIPLSSKNQRTLQHPHIIDNALRFISKKTCSIYCKGVELFKGVLEVVSAKEQEVNIRVLINALQSLKDMRMDELDMGYIDMASITYADLRALMLDSVTNTDDHNFVFCPVHNQDFWENKAEWMLERDEFQNYFNIATGEFVFSDGASAVSPFLKLEYVLTKIFEHLGFTFDNQFQTTRELKWLLLYNSYSIFSKDLSLDAFTVPLSKCLSTSKVSDFLKALCRTFAIAPFIDFFEGKVTLKPYKNVLAAASKYNWTDKVLKGREITEVINYPTRFTFAANPANPLPDTSVLSQNRTTYLSGLEKTSTGVYFVAENSKPFYYERIGDLQFSFRESDVYPNDYKRFGNGDMVLESKMGSLPTFRVYKFNAAGNRYFFGMSAKQSGWHIDKDNTTKTDILMFFRGWTRFYNGDNPTPLAIPYAANDTEMFSIGLPSSYQHKVGHNVAYPLTKYAPIDAQYGLHWNGDSGLFNKFWKEWYLLLQQKRDVTMQLNLSIRDIKNFSFQDKIRIQNQEYLVKKLKITLSKHGLQPTEAELVSLT